MAKFMMECPNCGKFVEASTGWFAKKKIDCPCGYTINVKTDKVTSKVCASCGNTVVFDYSKGDAATCPVCKKNLHIAEDTKKLIEFHCPTCSCTLSAPKASGFVTCPLCDSKVDVEKTVAKEQAKKDGIVSLIKYEGADDLLVWKHPVEDFTFGSQLIVHESQEAIFFRDGKALDSFGAGRHTLKTQNIPFLNEIYKLPPNADQAFHSEVYFIDLTTHLDIKWGTDSKVRLFDPGSGLHIEIGARGSFNIKVTNGRKLLVKLVGTGNDFSLGTSIGEIGKATALNKFKALVMNNVKYNIARAIKDNNINILEIDSYLDLLSEKLRISINEVLEDYGLTMPEFFVTAVMTPDDDPNFKLLKEQFAQRTLRVREEEIQQSVAEAARGRKLVEAQTEADLARVSAMGEADVLRYKAQAEAEAYRMQAMAEAEEMRAKGYTYQQETARQVGLEAMQNGITGGGAGGAGMGGVGGAIGDVAALGVTLGAMSGVMGMTKEAMAPMMNIGNEMGAGVVNGVTSDAWSCGCGQSNITSNFCPSCGAKKPAIGDVWSCECGQANITSNFCPSCGAKKPAPAEAWACACGQTNITSKFCPSCGAKKPEAWTCTCGQANITTKFCPNCGSGKPETWDCSCGKTNISSKFCPECGKAPAAPEAPAAE